MKVRCALSTFKERHISPGRVAAIDYGTVRIGIAVSDSRRTIASPLENYTRRSKEADADYFRRLASDENIALFVVGLPVHLDGRESCQIARRPLTVLPLGLPKSRASRSNILTNDSPAPRPSDFSAPPS